jgi:spermidine synthase
MNKNVSPAMVYATALVLAACSLLYELLIAQTLATLAANTVVWYSVTIGLYLAAMGLGALLHERYAAGNLWARLFRVELLLSAVGALAVPVLHFSHTCAVLLDLNDFTLAGNVLFFGSAFVLIAIIGMLTGFELPLLIDLGNTASSEKRVTNRVLAFDYMGSLLGGLAFPLVLMPYLGLIVIGLLTAGVNLIVALIALRWWLPKSRRPALRVATSGSLATAILIGLFFALPIEQYFVKNYYFYYDHRDDLFKLFGSLENTEDVFRARSPYQRIDIVHDETGYDTDMLIDAYSSKFVENPLQPRDYVLFLNGDFQLTSSYEEYYHEFFAHVPIITNGVTPRRVLVMGAGDGLLIRELIKYPDIETIVHVDLDSKLVELAETHPVLLAMNEGAFGDPRVHTYFDDAYRYIRNTTESFDAIYLDFPAPFDYNLSKLYSREFFYFVRQHLAPDGFIVLDTPGLKYSAKKREIYTSTIKMAGFNLVQPYISKIENYNPEAMNVLTRLGNSSAQSRRILARHARFLRYGFVIARDTWPEKPLYLDPRVKLHVLTDERLLSTLQNKIPPLPPLDPSKVNSIFRPTLPAGSIWEIRSAW